MRLVNTPLIARLVNARTLGGGGGGAILDGKTAPTIAFSTRLLLTAYTGPAVKLGRDSDNATDDFTADVDGNLTNASAQDPDTWGGGAGLRVDTWYDQTGNGAHVTRLASTGQPAFTQSDATFNGRASLSFDNTNDALLNYATCTLFDGAAGLTVMSLIAPDLLDQTGGIISIHNGASSGQWWQGIDTVDSGRCDYIVINSSSSRIDHNADWPAGASDGAACLFGMLYDGADIHSYFNGTEFGTATAQTGVLKSSSYNLVIGNYQALSPAYFYDGRLSEIIAWDSALASDERGTIGADMMTAYLP